VSHLAPEALGAVGTSCIMLPQDLEGHLAPEERVVDQVDFAHSAASEPAQTGVAFIYRGRCHVLRLHALHRH
jgi:hypothetical protein